MENSGESYQPTVIGWGIIIIFLGTSLLSLRMPNLDYIIPYAPYLLLLLQVGIFILLLPFFRIKIFPPNLWLLMGLSTLFGWALISSFWSPYPELVFQRSWMILGTSLFIYGLALADSRPAVTFFRLAQGFSIFGAAVSLIGLVIYAFGTIEMTEFGYVSILSFGFFDISQRVFEVGNYTRISSLFGNPNSLAAFLMVSLTMNVYLLTKGSSRILWGLFALIQGIAIITTYSRAGLYATVISLILFWYLSTSMVHQRRRKCFVLCFGGFCVVLVFALFSLDLNGIRLLSLDPNFRDLILIPMWESFCSNPVKGIGFGVSYEAVLLEWGLDFHADCAFIALIIEIGLLGFFIFILVWFMPMFHIIIRLRSYPKTLKLVFSTCLSISMALVFHQMFEFHILRYTFHNLLWIYLLTLMVHPRLAIGDTRE